MPTARLLRDNKAPQNRDPGLTGDQNANLISQVFPEPCCRAYDL